MPKYHVYARRVTLYEVRAETAHDAEDLDDELTTEIGQDTEEITAIPVCPTCNSELTNRTTRTVERTPTPGESCYEEATYCDTCDREVIDDVD